MADTFDACADDYTAQLQRGLALAGEGQDYFALGRMKWLKARLNQRGASIQRALDFGCGTGTSSPLLREYLGASEILGVDVSARSIEIASSKHGGNGISFALSGDAQQSGFDLAFCNGVFHHIPPANRAAEFAWIFERLRPGGYFAFWENNPWNPGTRWIMSRIEFDRDAILVWPGAARRALRTAGFRILLTDFAFIFPGLLARLRFAERPLCKLPLGGQYLVLAQKPEQTPA